MFNYKTNQVLGYELESSRIKSRLKGSVSLSYLEGFDIIETLIESLVSVTGTTLQS